MDDRRRIAVIGLADGPEAEAGASILACLDSRRHARIGVCCDANESGAMRPDVLDRSLIVPPLEDPGFAQTLAEAVAAEGLSVLLPGSARAAVALATARESLAATGVGLANLRRSALEACAAGELVRTARRAGVAAAPSWLLPDAPALASFSEVLHWPILLIGAQGGLRQAGDAWEALRAHEALIAEGPRVRACAFDPQAVWEVALVLDPSGAAVCGAAVRVLASDDRRRPWMAVTVDDRALVRTAARFSRGAGLVGPVHLLFTREGGVACLVDARAGFPLWVEVALAGGPNPVECAVTQALGEALEARADFPCTPPGVLFSQTAEDHAVATDAD
ncbi:MAG: hypothetical protein QF903_08145 [Planctomycetota bacterium]|jgi:hypothetical protein|nr:hypothetical protein [Planctomycetota bacterium]MDP6761473.1 hypothetical protein [Planctomycetota bacterium]MDP6989435.1 hypothetical protein [Planctomycetota bacterium]